MNESILLFLQQLHGAMANNEQFRVEFTKAGDSLDVIVLPLIKDDESKVPEDAKAIRSALSMPLSMRNMSLEDIAGDLGQRLSGFGQARSQANDAYQELLASLSDATANAKNTTAKKSKKDTEQAEVTASGKPTSPPEEKAQEVDDQTTTPKSQEPSSEKPSGGLFNY